MTCLIRGNRGISALPPKRIVQAVSYTHLTSQIDGLVLSDSCEELRGLTVDLYQAAELSKRLGLMIK